jgi:uncharacterized protein (TIGR00299 family) protein
MTDTGGRIAVFDCFSGIAGDMTLAALVDAGAPLDAIAAALRRMDIPSFALATEEVQRAGTRARYLRVSIAEEQTYQPDELRAKVVAADYPPRVTARALAAIAALERGETGAHATAYPHFHEVGGVDALIDIAGTMLALEALAVAEARCPVVTVGAGAIVRAAHGALPASPGPAAAAILEQAGFPLRFVDATHELVTPTGAAILAAVATPGAATLIPLAHGVGAGTMDPPGRPNAVRVFIGTPTAAATRAEGLDLREVVQLEANIDDMSPALLAHVRDLLLTEGALDAWLEPVGMKKGRPGTKLCMLTGPEREAEFAARIIRETTTLGVRVASYRRYEAPRLVARVATPLGEARMKVRDWPASPRRQPEHDDVAALAAAHGLPALAVQRLLEALAEGGAAAPAGDEAPPS